MRIFCCVSAKRHQPISEDVNVRPYKINQNTLNIKQNGNLKKKGSSPTENKIILGVKRMICKHFFFWRLL